MSNGISGIIGRIMGSFNAKLSAIFLVLMLGLGVALAVLGVRAAARYADEAQQKLNRTLAADLAPRFEPLLRDSVHHGAVQSVIKDLTMANRRIEIYLLDGQGHVKAQLGRPERTFPQRTVDLAPIHRFIRGAALPILGEDPADPERRAPFSVAPTEAMGESDCYLYVLLSSQQYASAAGMVQGSYILRATLWGLGLILLCTGIMGLGLFTMLTRRLRERQQVIEAFEAGDFSRRVEVDSADEIGQLGAAFNRMADAIQQNMDELREADRMRRELIANVSHDLRSPIASTQGYLETILLKGDALAPDERERYLEIALKNAQTLATLVSELFELSKLDAREVRPEPEAFSLSELVQDVVMQHRQHAEREGVRLDAALPKDLPPVRADIGLVERALSNLIENALSYTPEGGGACVMLKRRSRTIRISVSDTGPGIPEAEQEHIFERFYRVEKSRKGEGSGLGLAIASKALELQGSTLSVHSQNGQGASFWFDLPVA